MFTYLAIIFGSCVLLGLFIFRVNYVLKGKDRQDSQIQEPEEEADPIFEEKVGVLAKKEAEEIFQEAENLLDHRKEDEAMKLFIKCLASDPHHHGAQNALAMIYLQKQMYGPAASLFKQLAELTQDPKHFSHLGLVLFQQSDFEGAKIAYQQAVALDDDRPERFMNLAQVYRQLKQNNLAEIAILKALEKDQENLDFLFFKADLLFENGKLSEAKELIYRILDLNPEFSEAKALLKEIKKEARAEN